ncbi:MAG: CBS domain-containing protein [Lachnospiraceae bacterium]
MNILFFLKPKVEVAYLYDDYTIRQALETMEHHRYSSIPLLNRNGKYVGTITEGDLLWTIKRFHDLNLKKAETTSVMDIKRHQDYTCVHAETDMEDLIMRAKEQNFIPVEDDQGNFIGIITRKDIIAYCYEKLKEIDK